MARMEQRAAKLDGIDSKLQFHEALFLGSSAMPL